jgi:hypothetical protein
MFKRGLVQFWNALKDNWVPAIGIWVLGALVVYGYYHGGFVRSVSDEVLVLRGKYGLLYPIASMVVFGAILPSFSQIAIRPSDARLAMTRLPWLALFWAYKGVEIEYFYKLQAVVWGDSPSFWHVAAKVFTDQFIYNPILGAVTLILALRWIARRVGEIPADTKILGPGWYKQLVVPLLVATWVLWIPAVSLVYMMPTALQLPLANLIMWLWSMMLIFMAKQKN